MSRTLALRIAVAAAILTSAVLLGRWPASASGSVVIDTIAGGYANDGGTATATTMDHPQGVAVSGSSIYVVDSKDCRVRKITGTTSTTIAGNGGCGFGGDGGVATSASLRGPQSVAVDSSGNVYIADTGNCRVRKVSGGVITTVAGTGFCFSNGDGGPATAAGLALPYGVAVDAFQNIFIADAGGCRIREVSSGTINTVAGNGTCGYAGDGGSATAANLNFPQGVAVDASGNIYIADTNNCMVRKVSAGTITLLAGHVVISGGNPIGSCAFDGDGLTATSSALYFPSDVAVSGSTVYIADSGNCLVRTVSGGTLNSFAGSASCGFAGDGGAATSAQLANPTGVSVDATGKVQIADSGNCRVRQVSSGTIATIGGDGTCGFAGEGADPRFSVLHGPASTAITATNVVYIADAGNCRVRKISGHIISTVAGTGTCGFGGDGGPATSALLNAPQGVAVDSSGNLYIADTNNCRVRKVTGTTITTIAGTGVCSFGGDGGAATSAQISPITGLAFDSSGNLYIGDTGNCRVRKITGTTISTVAGNGTCALAGDGGAATSASLYYPHGVALDASNNLYIADTVNCRIRKVTGTTISSIAGSGVTCGFSGDGGAATSAQLNNPQGVAVDTSGNVYIADTLNCRIRKITGTTISTYAGNGACTLAGDGGDPAAASLNNPYSVRLDAAGDVIVADTENNRVRIIGNDTDGDTLGNGAEIITFNTDPNKADTDGDGCGDGKEVFKFFLNANNAWDFYSVPVPALYAAPSPLTTFKDNAVSASDGQAVFGYFKRGAKTGQADYEADRNANGIKDGLEYDRTVAGPGKSGPPDGVIGASEAQVAFSQFKTGVYVC